MKQLWYWERHDVVNYLRANFLETEVEFTTESLIRKINNSKPNGYHFGYSHGIISKILDDLATEGYLEVRYISVKMSPNTEELPHLSVFSNKWNRRWGSKTLSIYKMVGRDEKLEKILN